MEKATPPTLLPCALGEINIIIVFPKTPLILNRSFQFEKHRCLPRIQLRNAIVLERSGSYGLIIICFSRFNQLAAKSSFPRFSKGVIEVFVALESLCSSDGVPIAQVAKDGLQKIHLGIKFEHIRLKAPAAELVVNLGSAKKLRGVKGGRAEFGDLRHARRGLALGVLHIEELCSLLVRFNRHLHIAPMGFLPLCYSLVFK
mmetsp:Transcript_24519/g.44352  ORF Transcript_24519/g.44352 Transcript_24519/m.44352 type:complete len:201 (-) Transcript_24519:507-1109(-)